MSIGNFFKWLLDVDPILCPSDQYWDESWGSCQCSNAPDSVLDCNGDCVDRANAIGCPDWPCEIRMKDTGICCTPSTERVDNGPGAGTDENGNPNMVRWCCNESGACQPTSVQPDFAAQQKGTLQPAQSAALPKIMGKPIPLVNNVSPMYVGVTLAGLAALGAVAYYAARRR